MVKPFLLNFSLQAIKVKKVLAPQLHHSLLSKSLDVADGAKGVSIFSQCNSLILSNAIFMKARWVNSLSTVTTTRMTTFQKFLA